MKMTSPSVAISSESWCQNMSGIRIHRHMITLLCLVLLSVVLSGQAWAGPIITAQAVLNNGGCGGNLFISGSRFGTGTVHIVATNVKGLANPQKFAQTWTANKSGKVNIAIPYSFNAFGICSGTVPVSTITATGVHGKHASTTVSIPGFSGQACPIVWGAC